MIKRICIALVVAHFLTAGYALLWLLPGNAVMIKANLFLNKAVMPGGMELAWYYKYMSDHILLCVVFACFSIVSFKYSRKLFLAVTIFSIYHLLDFIMFLVDFNQSWWLYIAFGVLVLTGVIVSLWPIKDECRVVKME